MMFDSVPVKSPKITTFGLHSSFALSLSLSLSNGAQQTAGSDGGKHIVVSLKLHLLNDIYNVNFACRTCLRVASSLELKQCERQAFTHVCNRFAKPFEAKWIFVNETRRFVDESPLLILAVWWL